jgi:hypothetical protein
MPKRTFRIREGERARWFVDREPEARTEREEIAAELRQRAREPRVRDPESHALSTRIERFVYRPIILAGLNVIP